MAKHEKGRVRTMRAGETITHSNRFLDIKLLAIDSVSLDAWYR